ncbi:hypothetical protein QA596_01160 [Balneolales bacterium ANBcel1]|nr:hypothetical protein [Balneolales bacterium ANBcel1]
MNDSRKKRLAELGPDALSDALLQLAEQNDIANELVERLIATPEENVKKFKAKLAGLKRSRRFIRWGESYGFSLELQQLLEMLKEGADDPVTGSKLVAKFYECDEATLGRCDDSSGYIGDVFRYDAAEIFSTYAQRCSDKEWLADLVFDLNKHDGYGVRDALIHRASEYLPESVIRSLIHRIQQTADAESDEYHKRHWLLLIESLARQIRDPELFLKTRQASWDSLNANAWLDIAEVYLESGDAQSALGWLEKISDEDVNQVSRRDRLLLDVYGKLGKSQNQKDIAWRRFRSSRTFDGLQELLAVIGKDQYDAVLQEELPKILADSELSPTHAAFLVDLGLMEEAGDYILERAEQLNGDFYSNLLPLAKALEQAGYPLPATVVYRSLLDSILRRGKSTIYHHGVRYLKKLDRLATEVDDWKKVHDHQAYVRELRERHGRKTSFWGKYEG